MYFCRQYINSLRKVKVILFSNMLKYNSSIKIMFSNDSLVQVLDNLQNSSSTIIRKTVFDVTLSQRTFQNIVCLLTETAIILRIKNQEIFTQLRILFSFNLLFQLLSHSKDQQKENEVLSISLERGQNKLILKSSKNHKQFEFWFDYFQKNLNQKAIKKIGKGSFATVYLVQKLQNNSKFAVKSFSKQLLYSQEKGKESLIKEIELMRKFNHKNLIKIYGVYETDHSIYIVIELLEGGVLSDRITKKQKNTALQIKMIMKTILQGLEAMHKKNIMHRDLKPENILFRRADSCECVLADFGLAQYVNSTNYLFVRCGTPGFVAPEIVNLKDRNAHYTQACDLFSVGIIFHMLLLKKSPFPGKQYNEVLSQNRACNFNFQSFQYRQLPEASIDLLQRLLQKNPVNRISASQALKHAFFYSQFTIWQNTKKLSHKKSESKNLKQNLDPEQVESPLMMTRSNQRKKMTHIRGDSCLKFKMKQHIFLNQNNQIQQKNIIDSPELKSKIFKQGNLTESRFKKIANNQN